MVDPKNENISSQVDQTLGQNLNAGGNILFENITQIGQQINQQKLDFYEPDIEKNQPSSEFANLNIIPDLIDDITKNRLLVLGENSNIDLAKVARYLAFHLSNNQKNENFVVKEWYRNSDPQSIDVELQNTTENTIFVLTQVSPQNIVGYDLLDIQKAASSSSHYVYVIVTTDTPFAAWKLPEIAKSFWRNLSTKDVANCEELINTRTDEDSVHKWYYKLKRRDKLLALGLSFFDGLFDDQFFAAFEEVVESAWQRREPTLRALDYCDLDNLDGFFNFTKTNTQRTFVEVRFPKQRQMLLKVAWKDHRRQILAALPVLVNLVKNSVRRYESELYGSSVRCDQLRRVITETISNIGLIASDAVEDTLLNLAADENIHVQEVAAQAMAFWRDEEKRKFIFDESKDNHDESKENHIDSQLFEILQRWQNEARTRSLVDAILNQLNQKQSKQSVDYIRATIALTVGYAALYDPRDNLSPELLELLKDLISEQNEFVKNRVFTHTLPRVILQHTIQLRDILPGLLRDIDDLVTAVADSLAIAYRFRPDDVLKTLNFWNQQYRNKRPDKINIAQVTSRDALVAIVALTYGKIECDQIVGTLTPQQAVQNLATILSEELHPRIREIAIFAIGLQADRAFEEVELDLQKLVTKIAKKERHKVAEILTEIYLEQRTNLSDGERLIEVDKKLYPVWLNSLRPLTTIEKAMLSWVKNQENPMAQQVATNALANFANRLEREEESKIKQLREGRDPSETKLKAVYADPIKGGQPPQDWYFGKLIPWLATRKAEDYRISIRNLVPEGLRQYKKSRNDMKFVLRKLDNNSDGHVKTISGRLTKGLWWAEYLGWLTALGIGGVLTLVGVAATNLSKYPDTTVTKAIPIDPSITIIDVASVSDVDSANFNTGKLVVKFSAGSDSDDRLGIYNQGKDSGKIGISGSDVTYGGTSIGRFEGGKESKPLVIDLNSNANLEAVQTLMRNITYLNLGTTANLGSRKVEFQVTDDGGASSLKPLTRNIFVTRKNSVPNLTVPEGQVVNENAPLNISGINVKDSDSSKNFTVTLSVTNGTITVKDSVPKGLKADNINDNNTKTVKLIGNPGQIKATLANPTALIYKGIDNDSLSITVDDGGQDIPGDPNKTLVWPLGAQDAVVATKAVQIVVNPANKIPFITIPELTKTVDEDQDLIINGIRIHDKDTLKLTVKIGVEHGTLAVKTNVAKGLKSNEILDNKTGIVILTGELSKIKATLADPKAIIYRGIQDFNGNDSLSINIDDKGRGKTDKLSITVNPVNDRPILSDSVTVNTPDNTPEKIEPQVKDSPVSNKPTPEPSAIPPSPIVTFPPQPLPIDRTPTPVPSSQNLAKLLDKPGLYLASRTLVYSDGDRLKADFRIYCPTSTMRPTNYILTNKQGAVKKEGAWWEPSFTPRYDAEYELIKEVCNKN